MRIGILQPSYLPWLGYFEQIYRVERFVFYDDVQFTKRDWRSRNRIKTRRGPQWLTVPVRTKGRFTQKISEAEIENSIPWARKHWLTIEGSYRRAPYFELYAPALCSFYERDTASLADLDIGLTQFLCECLGLRREFFRSSELPLQETDRNGRLLETCLLLGGDSLYEGAAGRVYVDLDLFCRHGVDVHFQDYQHPAYAQLWGEFVPYLSVIDLLFNCGPNSLDVLTAGHCGRASS